VREVVSSKQQAVCSKRYAEVGSAGPVMLPLFPDPEGASQSLSVIANPQGVAIPFCRDCVLPGVPAYRDLRQIRSPRNDESVIAFPLAYEDNRHILGAVQDLLRNASNEEFGDARKTSSAEDDRFVA
jgi:hypothetical protein